MLWSFLPSQEKTWQTTDNRRRSVVAFVFRGVSFISEISSQLLHSPFGSIGFCTVSLVSSWPYFLRWRSWRFPPFSNKLPRYTPTRPMDLLIRFVRFDFPIVFFCFIFRSVPSLAIWHIVILLSFLLVCSGDGQKGRWNSGAMWWDD